MTYTVFLDRDGVFNRLGFPGVTRWHDVEWLPGAKEAFAKLNRPDIQTCLCTNQPMVGHLLATPGMVRHVNERLCAGLEAAGGRLDHVEAAYSPVFIKHRRRKPRPGMLEDGAKWLAANRQPVDMSKAVMIGDTVKDAQAAAAFGIPGLLLATTHTEAELREKCERLGVIPTAILPNLDSAVDWVLKHIG